MLAELKNLFVRDLNRLKDEINLYKTEANIWIVPKGISNSAGNLCLHIVGNLNHFIGAVIFDTGYIRDREAEFGDKNVPVSELNQQVDDTITLFEEKLLSMEPGLLNANFPIQVFGYEMTTRYFLIHLQGHLNYHLGQINYHRRLIEQ